MQDRDESPQANHLLEQVRRAWPVEQWRDVQVAVAVSGGADSTALLRVLAALQAESGGRGVLAVIHYNHALRGEASKQDAQWVVALAEQLDMPCISESAAEQLATSEEALRNARRAFYARATGELGARFLATGHTADDQAETVLFRALRGSGMRGLAGIRTRASLTEACTIVRPLLCASRQSIEGYLNRIGQPWRTDRTNESNTYSRNWIRHELLPAAELRVPGCRENLRRLGEYATELAETVETLAEDLLQRAAEGEGSATWRLDMETLRKAPPLLATEAIRLAWRRSGWPEGEMTAAAWRRIAEHAQSLEKLPAEVFPGAIRVEQQGPLLVLAPQDT